MSAAEPPMTPAIELEIAVTILEKVFELISFEAPDMKDKHVVVDADYVRNALTDIVKDQDLTRYIL